MLNRLWFKAFECNARSSTLMCSVCTEVLRCWMFWTKLDAASTDVLNAQMILQRWLLLTGHCALLLAIEGVLTTSSKMYNVSPIHPAQHQVHCSLHRGVLHLLFYLNLLHQSFWSKSLSGDFSRWLWCYESYIRMMMKMLLRKILQKPSSFSRVFILSIILVCMKFNNIWILPSDVINCIFHLCQSYYPREREMAMLSTSPPSPPLVPNPCPANPPSLNIGLALSPPPHPRPLKCLPVEIAAKCTF